MIKIKLPIITGVTYDTIEALDRRLPFVIRNGNVGPCTQLWNFDYLSQKEGNTSVKVHVTQHANMDFVNKNFLYKTLTMTELLNRVQNEKQSDYFLGPDERYYLRALGTDARGRDVADLTKHWPKISNDFQIPSIFPPENFFSSVLRVSSKDVRLWTHYDIMDNILVQVRGRKEVILWHPKDLLNMYMVGDKSAVLDVLNIDEKKFPLFKKADQYYCTLEEGDILYIPALWFHNTYALTAGIAVNVFWKNLESGCYDPKDPYGNKDLIYGAKALASTKSTMKNLEQLPKEYRNFYIRRMIDDLTKKLE